jgi:hypothetical protein
LNVHSRKEAWPPGTWGDNLWCLAALYLNEKTDEANARMLKRAEDFIASKPENLAKTSPEDPGKLPWTFFSITDYLRILYLFHAKSPHFPGRLKPETEAAMKESLWLWVRGESRLAEAGPDDQFLLLGTENHDLNRRPPCYLITAFLKADPAYRDRKLDDGHSVAEHAAAYTATSANGRAAARKTGSGSRSDPAPIRNTHGPRCSICTSFRPIRSSATASDCCSTSPSSRRRRSRCAAAAAVD